MQVSLHNKVKVYNLTAGKSLPEWLAERKAKRRRAAGDEQRIELIHGLDFPHFARCMFRSENGSYIFAAGDYPPRLKCFDVNQLSMKFSFNADMPVEGGVCLSADFRKFALRGQGRMITVHNCSNIVDRVRVPHAMRGLIYHDQTAELITCGADANVHRLSLESGAFVEPFVTMSDTGVNAIDFFRGSGVLMAACENGTVEAWDPRAASRAATLVVSGRVASGETDIEPGQGVTHVSADPRGGLLMAAGTTGGAVALYDVRSSRPVYVKNHFNGLPIVKTMFYQGRSSSGDSTHILSADTRGVKIWAKPDGALFTSLEAPAEIYDFTVLRAQHNMAAPYECDDSGVICVCCDVPKVQVHFIPQLGVAPRWCSFLDSITEELEEKETTVVYDGYDFVSTEEMNDLGLNPDDVTEGKIRPYMHGFLVDSKLFRELKAFVNPSDFAKQVVERQHARRQEKLDNRISSFKRKEPVPEAAAVEAPAEAAGARPGPPLSKVKQNIQAATADPRFASRMEEQAERFAFDKKNPEFVKLLQTIDQRKAAASARHQRYEASQFEIVDAAEPEEDAANISDGGSSAENDALARDAAAAGRKRLDRPAAADKRPLPSSSAAKGTAASTAVKGVTMYAAVPGTNVMTSDKQIHESRKRDRDRKLTLEERLRKAKHAPRRPL